MKPSLVLVACLSTLTACASEADTGLSSGPSRSVTQGGPQDVAEFRAIVEGGQVPELSLLDEVGFFAEHALDLPPADCGQAVCVHPMLAVAPRFDGGNWSMAFVGVNTNVDPTTLPARPRHLVLIIEHSRAVTEILPSFAPIAERILSALSPEDRVSVIFPHPQTSVAAFGEAPGQLENTEFPILPQPSVGPPLFPGTDLYAALAEAREITASPQFEDFSQRVLLFTSGSSDHGVQQLERYLALGRTLAEGGVAISTFGMGRFFRREIPAALADVASGNYYFAEDVGDLRDAVDVEAKTAFVALARDFELSIDARPGYRIGRVYGARTAVATATQASITTPTLFLGARTGSGDVETGRRGGGGGFFVELRADVDPTGGPPEPADVFSLSARYIDASSAELVEQTQTLVTPLGVGQNPPVDQPFFSDAARAKPFMMLNMYLALHTQIALFEAGDCGNALGVYEMMGQSYEYWRSVYADPDIDADYSLLADLTHVIEPRCAAPVAHPVHVPYGCFMF